MFRVSLSTAAASVVRAMSLRPSTKRSARWLWRSIRVRCAADLEVVAPGLGDDVLADLRIEGAEAFATRHIGDLYSYDVLPEINEAVESRTGTPLPQPVYSDWGPQVLEKYGQDALEYLETDVADGMDLRVEDRLAPAVAQALRAYRADPALAGQEPYTRDARRGVQVDSALPPERRIVSARTLDAATSPDAGSVDRRPVLPGGDPAVSAPSARSSVGSAASGLSGSGWRGPDSLVLRRPCWSLRRASSFQSCRRPCCRHLLSAYTMS